MKLEEYLKYIDEFHNKGINLDKGYEMPDMRQKKNSLLLQHPLAADYGGMWSGSCMQVFKCASAFGNF